MSTLWVVGDSTLSSFDDKYYYPRYGYGTKLGCYLNSKVQVNNLALSGRSSLSFTKEENYKELLAGMKAGDFLIIGFGHNDEKTETGRYTSPIGGKAHLQHHYMTIILSRHLMFHVHQYCVRLL
jgi:lysophospholipase L1-like esterase